jgi:HAD superfamily hydrolase (TIGR01662 family)
MTDTPQADLDPQDQRYCIVIPTLGRPSLQRLLDSLSAQFTGATAAPAELIPERVVIVDDRPGATGSPLLATVPSEWPVRVVRSFGRGPAAARNLGWQLSDPGTPWVVFLDDDVELPPGWVLTLADDLRACGPAIGGSQGRIEVPLPTGRRPTDWERGTAGLSGAAWATADMAYRRAALAEVAGFDERFPRAYREDADLALRVRRAGRQLVRGERRIVHPVRPADDWVSLRVQRGNADDVLMRRLHGRSWRADAEIPRGRFRRHLATTACAALATVALATGRRRLATVATLAWAGFTADFARARIAPGPQPGTEQWGPELRRMLATSVAIPPAAVWHRLRGHWRWRAGAPDWPPPVRAVLFDRDGTLVHDVPYNGDPSLVRPIEAATRAVQAARAAGLLTGVVTNQSGIARGLLTREQVDAVNAEVDRRLGPFGSWQICPHADSDRCSCRKPQPGMIFRAARELGVRPEDCAVIGDIGADVEAARAAGARGVLVPTAGTRPEEIADAPVVAQTAAQAVEYLIAGPDHGSRGLW